VRQGILAQDLGVVLGRFQRGFGGFQPFGEGCQAVLILAHRFLPPCFPDFYDRR